MSFYFFLGVSLLGLGLVYLIVFAGIPYQDAPVDVLARYSFHNSVGNTLMLIGAGAVAIAGIWWVARKIYRV